MFGWRPRVFASYSSTDHLAIEAVVALLRASRQWVFFAPDSIRAGVRWELELRRAIKKCTLMVVFWCRHAQESEWVAREFNLAIELKKQIVPVLLDDSTLPDELKAFQGIDFRPLNSHMPPSVTWSKSFGDPTGPGRPFPLAIIQWAQMLGSWTLPLGAILLLLAIVRPFPAWVQSEAIVIFNLVVGLAGILLAGLGGLGLILLGRFRSQRQYGQAVHLELLDMILGLKQLQEDARVHQLVKDHASSGVVR